MPLRPGRHEKEHTTCSTRIQTMFLLMMMLTTTLDMTAEPWRAINDGVMGGISAGRMVGIDYGLSFEGELSLENNGGFASVRRLVGQDLSEAGHPRLASPRLSFLVTSH